MSSHMLTMSLRIIGKQAVNVLHFFTKLFEATNTAEHVLLIGGQDIKPGRAAAEF